MQSGREIRIRVALSGNQRLPNEAEKVFVAVLRRDDKNLQALYGRAMVLVRQGKSKEALPLAEEAVADGCAAVMVPSQVPTCA